MTRVHVWYTDDGRIVAVGRLQGGRQVVPSASGTQQVLDVDVDEEAVATLSATHVVDTERRALVRRPT